MKTVITLFLVGLLWTPIVPTAPAQGHINLNFENVDLRDVLGMIARAENLQLDMPNNLEQTVTIKVEGVTLEEALNATLRPLHLDYLNEGNRLHVRREMSLEVSNDDLRRLLTVIGQYFGLSLEMPLDIHDLVSIDFKNLTLRTALDSLLTPRRLGYTIDDGRLIVRRR